MLRARAGECIIVRLANKLVPSPADRVRDNDDVESHLRGEPGYDPRHLPRILPLNAVVLQASNKISLLPQFVHSDAVHMGGVVAGNNEIPHFVFPGQVGLQIRLAAQCLDLDRQGVLGGTKRGADAVDGAQVESWLWRDGPAQHFSSGVWGSFEVRER